MLCFSIHYKIECPTKIYTMKSKISHLIILPFVLVMICQVANSQVPTGFNYQAVIRNSTGVPLANQNVSIRITLTDNTGTPNYYSEVHSLTTNQQGVVNLVVGSMSPQGLLDINNVQWKDGNIWLKVEVDKNDGAGYISMGLTEIQSVPYSQYAVNSSHTIVSSSTAGIDDPIFEVKNKDGNVVFGVYQEGVRININDGIITKGARGGFAVGGLTNQAKSQAEYFRITQDSARIYVKQNLKGARGGFAVGGLTNQGKTTSSSQLIQLNADNYLIGFESGVNLTSGIYNSFFGYQSGKNSTTGSYNVFSGYQSGMNNVGGLSNVFSGNQSGFNNISGGFNVFVGFQSGLHNIDGSSNVFIGDESGISNTTGWSNNFIGQGAGYYNTTGTNGIFIGNDAGWSNTTASGNIFIGRNSGYNLTGNDPNVYWGNVFLGNLTGENMTTGMVNLIAGVNAGQSKTSGDDNVILGSYAGTNNADGSYNVFVGAGAGNGATGNNNVFLGYNAGYSETGDNKLYINNSSGSIPLIGGDFTTHKVNISNILNLQSVSTYPSSPNEGDIVRLSGPSPAAGLYIYGGSSAGWKAIVTW